MRTRCLDLPQTFPECANYLSVGVGSGTWPAKVGFRSGPLRIPECALIAGTCPKLSPNVSITFRLGSGPGLGRQRSASNHDPSEFQNVRSLPDLPQAFPECATYLSVGVGSGTWPGPERKEKERKKRGEGEKERGRGEKEEGGKKRRSRQGPKGPGSFQGIFF